MEITPEVKEINNQLIEHFGIDTSTNQPIFRVVWANDHYEKRLSDVTLEGIQLLYPKVQLLPKYRFNRDKWILERLVVVPIQQQMEIPESELSYEPLWFFQDNECNALPPKWEVAKFVVDTLYAAMGKSSLAKYTNPDDKPEGRRERIEKLGQEMFGNETSVGDALAHHEGVGYTGPSKIEEN